MAPLRGMARQSRAIHPSARRVARIPFCSFVARHAFIMTLAGPILDPDRGARAPAAGGRPHRRQARAGGWNRAGDAVALR
jgi:hypothetical protein